MNVVLRPEYTGMANAYVYDVSSKQVVTFCDSACFDIDSNKLLSLNKLMTMKNMPKIIKLSVINNRLLETLNLKDKRHVNAGA